MGMSYALKAADELAKDGINAEVIDLRTLQADGHRHHHRIGEEDRPHASPSRRAGGSPASAPRSRRSVMEHAFDWLDAPVLRVTGKDVPMPYAANLEKLALPSVAEVVEAAKAVCYR